MLSQYLPPQPRVSAFRFCSLLGLLNNFTTLNTLANGNTGDKGIYALLAVVAIAGPAISQFWTDPLATLGNCLPLVLMLLVSIMFYSSIHNAASQAQQVAGAFGGNKEASDIMSSMMSNMVAQIMQAIHFGVGGVIAAIAAAYLTFVGAKQYLVAKAQA